MTCEPYNGKGMNITIDAVSKDGVKSQWGYNTMFDAKDEPRRRSSRRASRLSAS